MSARDFEELQQVHHQQYQYHPKSQLNEQQQQQQHLLQENHQQNHRLHFLNQQQQHHQNLNQQQEQHQQKNSNTHSNGRRQVGLMPAQGHDAPYKRSSSRSSKRSRLERTSYLMATGHLDIEETKQLTNSSDNNSNRHSSDRSMKRNTNNNNINSSHASLLATTVPLSIRAAGDQALLSGGATSNSNSFTALPTTTMNPFDTHDNNHIFAHNNFKPPKSSRQANKNKDRGQFRQTYTEVAMPMKTSPAFEYILKDDKRRHRRCYLWLIYSLLVTMCLAIIIFSSTQLVLRYQRGHHH